VAGRATDRLGVAWVRLLSPITPHLAEELGQGRVEGLVAESSLPSPDEFSRSEGAEAREEFLDRVEEDLRAVLRPAAERGEPPPEEVIFYVAEPWKVRVEQWLREAVGRGDAPNIRDVIERGAGYPEVAAHRAEIAKYVQRVVPLLRSEPAGGLATVDELASLRASEAYLVRRLGFRSIAVLPESEAESLDPLGRRERARPGRPAFYFVKASEKSDAS
jgi:leucyl-tRNA synthetase